MKAPWQLNSRAIVCQGSSLCPPSVYNFSSVQSLCISKYLGPGWGRAGLWAQLGGGCGELELGLAAASVGQGLEALGLLWGLGLATGRREAGSTLGAMTATHHTKAQDLKRIYSWAPSGGEVSRAMLSTSPAAVCQSHPHSDAASREVCCHRLATNFSTSLYCKYEFKVLVCNHSWWLCKREW